MSVQLGHVGKPRRPDGFEPNLTIRALADGGAELDILDAIGFWGITAGDVAKLLKDFKGEPVNVRINSPGGDAFDGAAIYNLLAQHDGKVTVNVIGLAASAASVIAMAGDTVQVAESALMMIHDPWIMAAGDADFLIEVAAQLEKDGDALAKTYARKSGRPADEIRDMMRAETWFSADEAVEAGLADEVTAAGAVAASIREEHMAIFGHDIPEQAQRFVAQSGAMVLPMRAAAPLAGHPPPQPAPAPEPHQESSETRFLRSLWSKIA